MNFAEHTRYKPSSRQDKLKGVPSMVSEHHKAHNPVIFSSKVLLFCPFRCCLIPYDDKYSECLSIKILTHSDTKRYCGYNGKRVKSVFVGLVYKGSVPLAIF